MNCGGFVLKCSQMGLNKESPNIELGPFCLFLNRSYSDLKESTGLE